MTNTDVLGYQRSVIHVQRALHMQMTQVLTTVKNKYA